MNWINLPDISNLRGNKKKITYGLDAAFSTGVNAGEDNIVLCPQCLFQHQDHDTRSIRLSKSSDLIKHRKLVGAYPCVDSVPAQQHAC